MRDRVAAEVRGRRAEALAGLWLQLKGWRILARRVRVPGGEIDLVARRGRTLAFVEVKQRATAGAASYALDEPRLARVAAAAEQLAHRYGNGCDMIRIDVVYIVPGRLPRHQENVWSG
ncbi:YraN family protein [Sphingomonas ginkgonis]|uniref:UPF0102 protein HMF7854_08495 n=1 Tax=Sphingomonas ginkgonis TaxID=2315330 RepID=A0A3R9X7Y4_9SPHN|nr:YraN family protein [Sphingomonas ginkgonis]RST30875.1 YraN family protein [Sphingomonas ginkgonis]